MIEEFYPSIRPKKTPFWPTVHTPGTNNHVVQMAENGMSPHYNRHQAEKKHISVEEFVRRDKIARDAAKGANYLREGDITYPHTKELYEKHGKLVITYVLRSYADYENEPWDEAKAHMCVGVRAERGTTNLVCTADYLSRKEPV